MDSPTIASTPSAAPLIICAVLLSLTWPCVMLRLWVRSRIVRSLGWDDFAMIAAVLIFSIFASATIATRIIMAGKELPQLPLPTIRKILDLLLVEQGSYILAMLALKISLGFFFLRFAVKQWHRRLIYVTVGFLVIVNIFTTFWSVFACGVPRNTLAILNPKNCFDKPVLLAIAYFHGSVNMITDWIFVLLAMELLRHTGLDFRDNIIVGFLLVLGTISSICAVVRMVYMHTLYENDGLVHGDTLVCWSLLEPGVGIIAGSLATLRPLLRRLRGERGIDASSIRRGPATLPTAVVSFPAGRESKSNRAILGQRSASAPSMAYSTA